MLIYCVAISGAASRAIMGYVSAPCLSLSHNPHAPQQFEDFEKRAEVRFDSGELMNVTHHVLGRSGAYLKMDLLLNGQVPSHDGEASFYASSVTPAPPPTFQDSIYIDDAEEEYTEESPGLIRGRGSSTLRMGSKAIPFRCPEEREGKNE